LTNLTDAPGRIPAQADRAQSAPAPSADQPSTTPSIDEILVVHHSHLDVGYTHAQPVVWELQAEFISQAISWLESTSGLPADARPKWTAEATEPVMRWLDKASHVDKARFLALVAQGRIGLTALRWNTSALIDRAGLERLVAGKRELEAAAGLPIRVACQHDVPGVPWPLADVLLDAGVDFFVMAANLHTARPVQPRPGVFLWEAPSGRRLRVFNGHHYTMFDQLLYSWDDSVERIGEGWEALEGHLLRQGYRLPFVYLSSTCAPEMWDNAPPNPYLPDLIRRWNEAGNGPTIRYATPDDLRERAMAIDADDLPVLRGDWTDYWTFGSASTPTATALSRQAKVLLSDAAALVGDTRHRTWAEAADRIDLFDEHTWGFHDPSPGHPQAQTTELLNQSLAHEGHELASFAMMDALESLAGNPVADRGIVGALVCNPGPYRRVVRPAIPNLWFESSSADKTFRARRMCYESRPWRTRLDGDEARIGGPIELPPMSWQVIPLDHLPLATKEARLSHQVREVGSGGSDKGWDAHTDSSRSIGTITSPFHTLEYDPSTGRILSLVDNQLDRDILNRRHRFDLFAFVRERPDALVDGTREAFYRRDLDVEKFDVHGWQDWTPIRETATKATRCTVRTSADRITLERHLDAPGMRRLVQRISLSADRPIIELDAELEFEPNAEPYGAYFAFPLALDAGWTAGYDTAGQFVTLDDEQLPGACRGWVTTESFAAIAGEGVAVALLTPDAPMVQFGDFHFGPPLDQVPRTPDPLLLAWPANNYWMTNYPLVQSGCIRLRYGLSTHATMDTDAIMQNAYESRHTPLVWPVTTGGRAPGSGTLE
jgi:alpha-mannosidase